jgi:hypothetical protein
VATAAVENHFAPSIFEPRVAFIVLEIRAHFEKTAGIIPSAWNVARREFVGLSYVDEVPARAIRLLENLCGGFRRDLLDGFEGYANEICE